MTRPLLPEPNDDEVADWMRVNAFTGGAERLIYQNEGYEPRYCHMASKHHALQQGGRRVHGWAIWRFVDTSGSIIIAEHHSVWEAPSGVLIDVTPPASGGSEILFLRDDGATISLAESGFVMHTDRTNFADMPRMLRGEPVPYEFWLLSIQKGSPQDLYASRMGFDWADFPTSPDFG
ncbi:hypothetical protein ORIO_18545 [Cereibacter azotoformans]|uniref:hypothetical protein n=1 Tax=Cereibacter azotoformans TaxID=43057 RepID=UPI001EEAB77B|nr:hypothetical protein [Cereibacter azotoformans]ULB11836.1 hypothetical protein ORIO_18545 [Cereibacter azotoformans]